MGFAVHNRRRNADPVFIDVVAFERQAEVCQEHLAKGRMIAVQGPCLVRSRPLLLGVPCASEQTRL